MAAVNEGSSGALQALALRLAVGLAKRRALLAVMFAVAAGVALLIAPQLPRSFESEAVLQLRKSLATAVNENAGLDPTEADGKITEDYREVQTELLASGELREAVAVRMIEEGIDPGVGVLPWLIGTLSGGDDSIEAPTARELADGLNSALGVRRLPKAPVVSLTARAGTADDARRVLEILVEEYQLALERLYDVEPVLASATDELEGARARLEAARSALDTFRSETGLVDPGKQVEIERTHLTVLERQLAAADADYRAALRLSSVLERERVGLPQGFESEPTRIENKKRVALLDLLEAARRRIIESPFVEGSPEYEALAAPVDELLAELESEPVFHLEENPDLPNTAWATFETRVREARAEAAGAQARFEELLEAAAAARVAIANLDGGVGVFERLSAGVEESERAFEERREQVLRLERVAAMHAADRLWSFRLIQPPSQPLRPSGLGTKVALVLIFAAGAALALAITLFASFVDGRVASAADISLVTGSKPLTSLPDWGSSAMRKRLVDRIGLRKRQRVHAVEGSMFEDFGELGRALESRIDGLVGGLIEGDDQTAGQLVVVCAAHRGAGVSTIAANLATRLSRRLGEDVGLVRCEDAAAPRPLRSSVDVFEMRGDEIRARDARLVGTRFTVVDAPPLFESAGAVDLCAAADSVLLVVRGEATTRAALDEAVSALQPVVRGRIGVVLNRLVARLPHAVQPF